ncbi:hypothetical protein [Rhizobacter fulvus]
MTDAPKNFSAIGNAVMANIAGQRDANQLLFSIREGCAPADLLLDALDHGQKAGEAEYMRAFARTVQKALEHGR